MGLEGSYGGITEYWNLTGLLTAGANITISGDGTINNPFTISSTGGGGGSMAIGGTVTSGTPGSLLFVGAGPVLAQDNANLFWDATNARLGVGTNAPIALFEVSSAGSGQAYIHNSATSTATLYVKNFSTGPALFVEGLGNNYIQGNLGQNTTAPALTAANGFTLNSNSRTFEQRSNSTVGFSSLYLRRSDGAVGLDITSDNASTGTVYLDSRFNNTGPMFLFRGRTNVTAVNLVSMSGNGRVCIGGNTVPTARLHIDNSSGATEAGNLMQITNSIGATAFTIDNNAMYAQFYNGGGINNPSLGFNQGVGLSVSGSAVTSTLGLCVNNTAYVTLNTTGQTVFSGTGSASNAANLMSGAIFTGGTGTTTFPHFFIQPSGATAATTWGTAGTVIGINAATGFTGSMLDFRIAGAQVAIMTAGGAFTTLGALGTTSTMTVGAANSYFWTGRSRMSSTADGNIVLANNANSSFGLLQLGGVTSSFPAIKRNTTAINFRLADDSADCAITAAAGSFSGTLAVTTAGKGLAIKAGTNGYAGTATLVGGTVTVNVATITTTTIALLNRSVTAGTLGNLTYTITAATSITFNSSSILDTSTIVYQLIETA